MARTAAAGIERADWASERTVVGEKAMEWIEDRGEAMLEREGSVSLRKREVSELATQDRDRKSVV